MSLQSDFDCLAALVAKLRPKIAGSKQSLPHDLWADVDLYVQAARWALAYEPALTPAEEALVAQAIAIGKQRAEALADGKTPWHHITGRMVRGFVSTIDGSSQAFSLHVPANLDWKKPVRLDVVLDGSRSARGLACVTYLSRFSGFIAPDAMPTPAIPDEPDYIQMTPMARIENAYRFAGETDVFEAIEAVCRNYPIDRDRLVLRGMSMGGTGTWHIGLKHPGKFVAIAPYCGYVDTHRFSYAPFDHFPRVGQLPAHQEAGLHTLDSVDYAANVGAVPVFAAVGAHDPFVEAHTIMNEAVRKEGNQLINLVSPFTQHTIDPVTHKLQLKLVGEHAARGLDHFPREIRFVTWTLRYGKCHWLQLLGLGKHLERAEIRARVAASGAKAGAVEIEAPLNITAFAIDAGIFGRRQPRVIVAGQEVKLAGGAGLRQAGRVVLELRGGVWTQMSERAAATGFLTRKRPGIQGPIDDAFFSGFVCVRGTGKAWNPAVGAWTEACLERFADEWPRYWHGDLPVKKDVDVTADDVRNRNLILFGDPGSNAVLREIVGALPLGWTRKRLTMAGVDHDAATSAPLLIQPNPMKGGEDRYVVLNSGHTFRGNDSATINYLLFPRLGDWAVMDIGPATPLDATGKIRERPVASGYFDEGWGFGG
ncbi:MAG: prolyl oligopeptidase family serine peptidase [Planctomycetota bacterium]|nr:prolyl oligopeptidase family serine peptidase [Planctomycetota bacterium]